MTKLLLDRLEHERFSLATGISFKFIAAGVLWIVGSDVAVFLSHTTDPQNIPLFRIEVFKGIAFVLVIGVFIHMLVRSRNSVRTSIAPHAFEKNPIPMWIYDCESLQMVDVNEAALATFGYSRSQFLAMSVLDLANEEEAEASVLVQKVRKGLSYKGRFAQRSINGDSRVSELAVSPFQFNHRHAGFVVAHDVTAQVKLENEVHDLRVQHEKQMRDKLYETALYNKELQIRIREINATNDELVNVNKLLLDANKKFQLKVQCQQRRLREQTERLIEVSGKAMWVWSAHDEECRVINSAARSLLGFEGMFTSKDFWKELVDDFDKPLIDIHLAVLEKDNYVDFTYKLRNSDVLVRQVIRIFRNDLDEPVGWEYLAERR